MTIPVPADVISRLKAVLGEGGWSQDPDRLAPKLVEWRDRWSGTTPLLALPRSTAEVAAVVGVCAESGTAITPQGGNTGLVGGQIPDGEILLSLERMRAMRETNVDDDVLIVEAGLTLAEAHEAAAAVGRRFPLSLASEGSCTIGGLISTNAGGVAVLRYGTMRQLVLGLEAVLPNGEVWNGLKRLRKDNTGYDLKQLLIGAEGTLGVVTAAALKLFPELASRAVAIAGVESPAAAVELLGRAKEVSGGAVESFELIGRLGIELALAHIPGAREPLESRPPRRGRWSGCWRRRWPTASCSTPPSPRPTRKPKPSGPCARTSRRPRKARARPGSTISPCRSRGSPSSSRPPARRCRPAGPACASTPSATSATATSTTTYW